MNQIAKIVRSAYRFSLAWTAISTDDRGSAGEWRLVSDGKDFRANHSSLTAPSSMLDLQYSTFGGGGMVLDYNDDYDEPGYPRRQHLLRQSRLRIASLVIATLVGGTEIILLISWLRVTVRPADFHTPGVPIVLSLLAISGVMVSFVGVVMAIFGLQRGSSKLFPFLGLGLLGAIGIIIIIGFVLSHT